MRLENVKLLEGATIAVIGGGPAGSFFALAMQKQMERLNTRYRVVILEKKKELTFLDNTMVTSCTEGCNYCAGGISPRMSDVLKELELELPQQIIQSNIHSITVHGHWKNIELQIPKDRKMLSVYRGMRPLSRIDRRYGFDYYLLEHTLKAGAELLNANVQDVRSTHEGIFYIHYNTISGKGTLRADFVVFALGVNQIPGMKLDQNRLVRSLRRLLPGFKPPAVRRSLIFELEADPTLLQEKTGGMYFIESGSLDLHIEMCSIIPKEQFITVVLFGKSIDSTLNATQVKEIIERFIALPHVKKILPKKVTIACICRPNMTIGVAQKPFGERVAVIGDMLTSRLYKDGILSAHSTASMLATAITEVGIDTYSLRTAFRPIIRQFVLDNHFGKLVFMLHGLVFSKPFFSRILYQAIITERKNRDQGQRKLERILWQIASGDDRYKKIFLAMIRPSSLWRIFTGGGMITIRNYLTELIFGLDWHQIGRFTTGIYKEQFEARSNKYKAIVAEEGIELSEPLDFENMFSIEIRESQKNILNELIKFGNDDQQFFKPRMIRVKRVKGLPLQIGSILRYEIILPFFNFTAVFQKNHKNNLLLYRVNSGFPKGGVLIFEIEKKKAQQCLLSIYVAFNFPKGRHFFSQALWWLLKFFFPVYLHDVLWNHSLCKLKDLVEAK